ncbi:hypothetical protein IEQ34_019716 [Dendrobium chrysotoxum]|uniref:R13L1/DRL21-like LRR repeat region domain-containing protein n=1 Tax=Dendrobium chrysotoxum TaxID=161865 RepID=A0AAV7GA60_DENCH|nr:hypothetical protein IEQ34_019716 [Dendrobium chrysotoxum]
MGAKFAIWMDNVMPSLNLEKIKMTSCLEWETLPRFEQLPFLKSLKLDEMSRVKWLESKSSGNDKCHAFPLLGRLYTRGLKRKKIKNWFEEGVAAEDGCLFPCLIELVLRGCSVLKELPSLPSKIKTLEIQKLGG